MNDQNETAQLRFLEETATRLRQNGFTVEPIKDHHLPVCCEKGRLCRISGRGSVLYRQECVDSVRAQDALQSVIDTAKTTSEYMAILETATLLKAGGLTGDYRVLADFGSAVLGLKVAAATGSPTAAALKLVLTESDASSGTFAAVSDKQALIGGLLDADGAVTMDIPVAGGEAQIGIDLTGCKRFVKITGTVSFTGGTTPAATATYALALGDPAQEPVE